MLKESPRILHLPYTHSSTTSSFTSSAYTPTHSTLHPLMLMLIYCTASKLTLERGLGRRNLRLLGKEESGTVETGVGDGKSRQKKRPGPSDDRDALGAVCQQIQHGPGRHKACSVGDIVQHHVSAGGKHETEACTRHLCGFHRVFRIR